MSDLINQLSQAGRSSSILESIANPSVVNPLAAMAGAAQTAQSVYGVREKQAQQAVGDILQQATGEDGTIDYPKAQALAARAGPIVQMGMANFLKDASGLKSAQMNQGVARNTAVGNAIVGALNGDDAGLHDRVAAGLRGLIATGVMTPDEATKWALTMPNDPAQIRQRLEQLRISLMPSEQQQTNIYGTPGTVNTGPGTQGFVQAPASRGGGVTPSGPVIPHGLTPTETFDAQKWLVEPVEFPDQTSPGGVFKGTRQQWFQKMGVDPKLFYPAVPGGNAIPGAPPATGLPGSLRNPNAAPAPAAPAAAPGTPAATPALNPAGQPIPVPAQADLDYFRDLSTRAVASRDRSAQLGNMLGDVAQFTTGPLAGIQSKLRNFGIAMGIPGINVEAQSAREAFNKTASSIAIQQGAGSDARLGVATSANPHEELSPAGARLILSQLQGNEDYIQARAGLAANYNGTQRKFESEVASNLDPRAFQFARMGPAERLTWYNNLKENDQKAVHKSYNWAVEKGLIGGG